MRIQQNSINKRFESMKIIKTEFGQRFLCTKLYINFCLFEPQIFSFLKYARSLVATCICYIILVYVWIQWHHPRWRALSISADQH